MDSYLTANSVRCDPVGVCYRGPTGDGRVLTVEIASGSVIFISSLGSRHTFPDYTLGSMKAAREILWYKPTVGLRRHEESH